MAGCRETPGEAIGRVCPAGRSTCSGISLATDTKRTMEAAATLPKSENDTASMQVKGVMGLAIRSISMARVQILASATACILDGTSEDERAFRVGTREVEL